MIKGIVSNASKEMEMGLKSNYGKLCGKLNGTNNSGDGNSSEFGNRNNGNLDAYDWFERVTITVENDVPNNKCSVDESGIRLVAV